MKDRIERRAIERCTHQASITCAYFNSDRFYHLEATNHSNDGINFFSNFPMKPGSNIYVRINKFFPESHQIGSGCCKGARSLGLAEVKWCEEISGVFDTFYSIGLKYHEPEY